MCDITSNHITPHQGPQMGPKMGSKWDPKWATNSLAPDQGPGPGPLGPWAQAMSEHMDIERGPFGIPFGAHLGAIWGP